MHPRTVGRALALVALWTAAAQAAALVYVSRDGIDLRPGKDNSQKATSSLITAPAAIGPWETTPEVWAETVACVKAIYAPFAVTITEDDPGDVPYIHAVFGGSPKDLGLPRSYAGVSPFAPDCSVIERSIVFTFTDILPPDAESACHVMAQEIGHSFGLDHELAEQSPMSTANRRGARAFLDEDVACGETSPRPCGLPKQTCRPMQNSYALLADRVGLAGDPDATARSAPDDEIGCNAGGADRGLLSIGALLAALGRRRARVRTG
ncbi:MAG: hypothetical protein JNL83_36205 [Myxococcales bacterium]|nr:hypothetical protein [Myxococcales bacterium]